MEVGLFFMPENSGWHIPRDTLESGLFKDRSKTQIHSGGGSRARKDHIGMYGV